MKYFKTLFASLILCLSLSMGTTVIHAQDSKGVVCNAIGADQNCTESAEGSVGDVVASVVSILAWVAGIVAVVMIIIGGFKYMTSAGDAGKVGTAKSTLLYAVIGLAIAALTQVIVRVVVSETSAPNPNTNPNQSYIRLI